MLDRYVWDDKQEMNEMAERPSRRWPVGPHLITYSCLISRAIFRHTDAILNLTAFDQN